MVMSALVLGVVILLVGCGWTALRYRRAQKAALPLPMVPEGLPVYHWPPAPTDHSEAA